MEYHPPEINLFHPRPLLNCVPLYLYFHINYNKATLRFTILVQFHCNIHTCPTRYKQLHGLLLSTLHVHSLIRYRLSDTKTFHPSQFQFKGWRSQHLHEKVSFHFENFGPYLAHCLGLTRSITKLYFIFTGLLLDMCFARPPPTHSIATALWGCIYVQFWLMPNSFHKFCSDTLLRAASKSQVICFSATQIHWFCK